MRTIDAKEAYFIKLGRGGGWEKECLADGTLRLGYKEVPHEGCAAGNWQAAWTAMRAIPRNDGAATSDTNQIRVFYEADDTVLFITFSGGLMYWCRPAQRVEPDTSGLGKIRRTIDGWHSNSVGGVPLTADRLSGNLLKVQSFQGTICQVRARDYLLRKINDKRVPEVAAAEDAERMLTDAIVKLMRLLTWQDFELLVDLIFSNSGWRRIGVLGRTQKTVDIELLLPTTGERAFVQVKSTASDAQLSDYSELFRSSSAYDRMFFVWHTGRVSTESDSAGVTLVGPDRLSRMVVDAGLTSWLREKVS